LSPPKPKPKAPPKPKVEAPKDTTGIKKPPVPKVKKETEYGAVPRAIAKVIFSVKNLSLNYTEGKGTLLPGYTKTSEIMGQDFYHSDVLNKNTNAPGWGFVFGQQD